jgi:hypothetical protein
MNRNHTDLLDRLTKFEIDRGDEELHFAHRLARENGWRRAYAERVIIEYKRFVFLAMTAGHPVTPSDQVDQAWHLHLTYTRSYWDELCGQVLNRPLHHDPTRGGTQETQKYNDWYQRTIERYERAFGAPPPRDIWPPSSVRFNDNDFQRVNLKRSWIVPRAKALAAASILFLMTMPLVVTSCATTGSGGNSDALKVAGVVVGFFLLIFILKRIDWTGRGGGCGSGCGGLGCGSGCGGGCGGGD